jgi:tripartite-type tricarboxylate transporter receptor subunit TctC
MRGLGVATRQRMTALPEVPTFDEGGIHNFYSGVPHGILVPAGTPQPLIMFMNRTLNAIFQEPEYRRQLTVAGTNIFGGDPQALTAYIVTERKKWEPLIRSEGIKAY